MPKLNPESQMIIVVMMATYVYWVFIKYKVLFRHLYFIILFSPVNDSEKTLLYPVVFIFVLGWDLFTYLNKDIAA